MNFDQIAQALDITTEEILYFNPQYRKNLIPAGGNAICLPKNKIATFLNNEQAIYAAIQAQRQTGEVETIAEVQRTHIVKPGEKLSTIARKYGVTVAELKSWNYFGKKGLRPGKKVVVYVRQQKPKETKQLDIKKDQPVVTTTNGETQQLAENTNSIKKEFIWHKVRKGESLSFIAKKYDVNTSDLKEVNDLKTGDIRIGQLLKIKPKGE
jgi:membrane-bound lytic murein transglycosylase D